MRLLCVGLAVCGFLTGCGGGGDELQSAPPGSGRVDFVQIALDKVDAECASDPSGVECRKVLMNLIEKDRPEVFEGIERWTVPVCTARVDATCLQAVQTVVAEERFDAVEPLFAAESPAGAALCGGLDRDTIAALDRAWCGIFPAAEVCDHFIGLRLEAGDDEAAERGRQLELRTVVAEVASARGSRGGAALLNRIPKGPESIRRLAELAVHGPSITVRERNLIVSALEAMGPSLYPQLVSLVEHGDLETGLIAARAGWDPAAYEEEDDRPNEEPQRTVTLDESVDYLGKHVTVFLKDGTKREGTLKKIEGEYLNVEIRIGGGAVTSKILRSEVDASPIEVVSLPLAFPSSSPFWCTFPTGSC